MFFLIPKDNPTFAALQQVQDRIREVEKQAWALASELGASAYWKANNCIAGGISAFKMSEKPEGWLVARPRQSHQHFYPKQIKANKPLLERIWALPTVPYEELNQILNFKPGSHQEGMGFVWSSCPGLQMNEDFALMDVGRKPNYEPAPFMEEILESVFRKKEAELNAAREERKTQEV